MSAAKTLKSGDLFFLTYSGHGGQVDDTNSDEADRMDETWVCYDRQLVDDELYELWGKFKSGVRIVVLSDSCHSGTVLREIPAFISGGPRIRAMPTVVARKVQKANAKLYRKIQNEHRAAENTKVNASVLLISGCMDNQTSRDGARNGLFTGTLKKVWNGGKVQGRLSQAARHDRVEDAARPDPELLLRRRRERQVRSGKALDPIGQSIRLRA